MQPCWTRSARIWRRWTGRGSAGDASDSECRDREARGVSERAIILACAGARMVGVITDPDREPADAFDRAREPDLGVLFVVGGPQYRVGSHRLHVDLARRLAAEAGVASLRFDHRGLGDSEGEHPGLERIGPDIGAALDGFQAACPGLRRVVLFGLCGAVPPICALAAADRRVAGVVILNPWVRVEDSHDRVMLRRYYLARLGQRDFWANLLRGRAQIGDFARLIGRRLRAFGGRPGAVGPALSPNPLLDTILKGLRAFDGRVLLVISGRDLTADEFRQEAEATDAWGDLSRRSRVECLELPAADHTFSTGGATDALAARLIAWVDALTGDRAVRPRPMPAQADRG
nr:hydrolase 1, exosortase A system-associated [Rhodothalassium salexigens]